MQIDALTLARVSNDNAMLLCALRACHCTPVVAALYIKLFRRLNTLNVWLTLSFKRVHIANRCSTDQRDVKDLLTNYISANYHTYIVHTTHVRRKIWLFMMVDQASWKSIKRVIGHDLVWNVKFNQCSNCPRRSSDAGSRIEARVGCWEETLLDPTVGGGSAVPLSL